MNNEQNYNPNSAKHNDPWESNLDNEEWGQHQWENKNVPRHREGYFWGDKETFNETCNFLHKLDELPKDASVPPEMLKDALNGIVGRLNRLSDERNSLEEYEFNKIKARQKQEQEQERLKKK